jgi:hypothetical protein
MSDQQWTFREIMLIALIRQGGHAPAPSAGTKLVVCTRCNQRFDVVGRATAAANDERWQGAVTSFDPLVFPRCWLVQR